MLHAHGRYVGARDVALTSRPDLIFCWAIAIEGKIRESEVCARADNASERGVPFPAPWHNAVRCGDLSSRAAGAGRALEIVEGVSEISCSLVGVPKPCRAPSGDEHCPGAIVALRAPTGRIDFALVAHIDKNLWFCHAGSFTVSDAQAPARGCLD